MQYTSTRDNSVRALSSEAIARGIHSGGGLFVPTELPTFTYEDFTQLSALDYRERAVRILSRFLTDFTKEEIEECVYNAYTGKFGSEDVAPVVSINDYRYVLELWHGPTCAFKDMALQLLPHLLKTSVRKLNDEREVVILVATSGDTGKAALEGFANVPGTRILVFYPEDGVSNIQKLQMVTQEGENVGVCAIKGNFDDAQTGVKKIFTDSKMIETLNENGMAFSSANSINWGRLVPQIVYYLSAYADMMRTGEIDHEGEKVNIVVPTGNFGNILAAYYASKMGLPVNKLICASNANNVLTDFIRTGVYDRNRAFHTTISPSMDILISSNLERLIFHLSGGDSERVAAWMKQLNETGRYEVDADVKAQLDELFWAGCCDDDATKATIRYMFESDNYLCDTHTAVGVNVHSQYVEATGESEVPTIIASTASPYKFAPAVLSALADDTDAKTEFDRLRELSVLSGMPVPAPLANLDGKQVRFTGSCTQDTMQEVVYALLGIK